MNLCVNMVKPVTSSSSGTKGSPITTVFCIL